MYWDLQDGHFSRVLLFLPIFTGLLGLALLLFPGGPTSARAVLADPGTEQVGRWLAGIPRGHRRAWLLATGLSYYLSLGVGDYLAGKDFLSWHEQVIILIALLVVWLVLRKELRRLW